MNITPISVCRKPIRKVNFQAKKEDKPVEQKREIEQPVCEHCGYPLPGMYAKDFLEIFGDRQEEIEQQND